MNTVENLVKIGGQEWKKEGFHRVYFNDLVDLYGLKLRYYNSGNICSASLDGERISNCAAKKLLSNTLAGKFWFDVPSQKFCGKNLSQNTIGVLAEAVEAKIREYLSESLKLAWAE